MKEEQKKQPYTPPTLTEYGKVEEKTKGISGIAWEVYGNQPEIDHPGGAL